MSKKSESEILNTILGDLKRDNFKIIPGALSPAKSIDILAQKGDYLFAIEVKNHPIETFDIISGSAAIGTLAQNPAFQNQKVVGVITSGSLITSEAKDLGGKVGLIITEPTCMSDSLRVVLTGPNGKVKEKREQ